MTRRKPLRQTASAAAITQTARSDQLELPVHGTPEWNTKFEKYIDLLTPQCTTVLISLDCAGQGYRLCFAMLRDQLPRLQEV